MRGLLMIGLTRDRDWTDRDSEIPRRNLRASEDPNRFA